jgi:hypothetical protein
LRQRAQHTCPTRLLSLKCADSRPQTLDQERNVDAYSSRWDQFGPSNFSLQYPSQRWGANESQYLVGNSPEFNLHLHRLFLLEYTDDSFQLPSRCIPPSGMQLTLSTP